MRHFNRFFIRAIFAKFCVPQSATIDFAQTYSTELINQSQRCNPANVPRVELFFFVDKNMSVWDHADCALLLASCLMNREDTAGNCSRKRRVMDFEAVTTFWLKQVSQSSWECQLVIRRPLSTSHTEAKSCHEFSYLSTMLRFFSLKYPALKRSKH